MEYPWDLNSNVAEQLRLAGLREVLSEDEYQAFIRSAEWADFCDHMYDAAVMLKRFKDKEGGA